MKVTCPECGKVFSVKGHADGKKSARELTPRQQRASIAKQSRDLMEMRAIYKGGK